MPKACRNDHSLTYIRKDPTTVCVENRVFVSLPGLSGDAVLNAPATVELDSAGRIVAIEINGCSFAPAVRPRSKATSLATSRAVVPDR